MDQTALVRRLEVDGERLTAMLRDDPAFELTASFWWWDAEASSWLLVIASEDYKNDGPKSTYKRIQRHAKKLGSKRARSPLTLSMVSAISPSDRRVAAMASAMSVTSSTVRITGSNLNGVQVDGALIYELSLASALPEESAIPTPAIAT